LPARRGKKVGGRKKELMRLSNVGFLTGEKKWWETKKRIVAKKKGTGGKKTREEKEREKCQIKGPRDP